MKPSELLSDKSKWCRYALARTKEGLHIDVENPNAYSFCIIGALRKCGYAHDEKWAWAITKLGLELDGENISRFNDDPSTTYEQVINVLKKAGL